MSEHMNVTNCSGIDDTLVLLIASTDTTSFIYLSIYLQTLVWFKKGNKTEKRKKREKGEKKKTPEKTGCTTEGPGTNPVSCGQ